ncbi:MAG: ABC transporter ATP-binding protein [Xanthobacteraceae bacterium]|nr:ABC transporter ATP-binding protein [Xanthobacteraceae bacterium]
MVDQRTVPAIATSGLGVVYRTVKGPLPAVESLDLAIDRGSFVSILGPSGCGKSTLLKIVAGIMPATSGSAEVGGVPVTGPRRDVGVVFQQPTLLPWRTVLDNVMVAARTQNLDRTESRARALELIRQVRLSGFEHSYPHELSGGMQQRVGIARALLHEPDVLLMDEPFAALDALSRERMALELLDFWSRSRRTVMFITHGIQEAVFLSDRVVLLSARPARVLEDIAIDLPRPRTLETLVDPKFVGYADQLRRALFAAAEEGSH